MSERKKQIQAECTLIGLKLAECVMRGEALMKLHDSAAFASQGEDADKLRQQLHTLLDERLDHNARVMQLTRELMQMQD